MLTIARGTGADAPALLALFDDAVAWLVARGQTGQWGSEPFSARAPQVERAQAWAEGGGLWIARSDHGEVAGALVAGEAHDYVPRAARPELYVQVLLTASAWRGRGVGARLIEHAARLAAEQGAERLRVDCWDGVPALPAAYARLGFTRTGTFDVDGWPGAILVRPLDRAAPAFLDDFDGARLDTDIWVPHYLPQWSSRAASAAAYTVAGSELTLAIPPGHPVWCEGDHDPPLRVSGIQSGVSGRQQPFDGAVVREEQPERFGWTPHHGRIEVRARMDLTPRSMAAVWLVGLERTPERSAEICLFEVFGDTIEPDRAAARVGMGVHPFRDPAITDDFVAERVAIDVGDFHDYGVDWRRGRVDFHVDGEHVRTVHQAPDYPMQLMVAVFDFPDRDPARAYAEHVPSLTLDRVSGRD